MVRAKRASSLLIELAVPVLIIASARSTENSRTNLDSLAQVLDKKISDIENRIEKKIQNQWNDIQGKLDQILAAIDVLSNNNN